MNSETEKLRSKQEQGTQKPTGSVDNSDSKGNSLPKREPEQASAKQPSTGYFQKEPTPGHRLSAPRSTESRK
jgi:hypothetical protein